MEGPAPAGPFVRSRGDVVVWFLVVALGVTGDHAAVADDADVTLLACARVWVQLLSGRRAADLREEPYVPLVEVAPAK